MSVVSLYDQFGSGIRDLFSSAVSIKILLLLLGGGHSIPGICAETGHVHAAVLAKVRRLEEYGIVTHQTETYTLTTLGTVLATKILPLYTEKGTLEGTGDENRTRATATQAVHVSENSTCPPAFAPPPDLKDHYNQRMKEINLVCRSGIRTRLLLVLLGGTTDRDALRSATGCGASHFRTNIRQLIEAELLKESMDGIFFTPRGEELSIQLSEIVPVMALILRHRDFWRNHELRNLPWFALESIGTLAESEIIHDDGKEYFKTYEHYLGIIASARHIHGITGMANPGFADAITSRVIEGFPGEIIVPPVLALYLFDEPYRQKVRYVSTFPHFRFLVTELPIPPCMTVTDSYLSMKMFLKGSTTYDFMNGFVSTTPEALAWAERIFGYYRKNAVPIEDYIRQRKEPK